MPNPTIIDVAKHAGVSKSTVSLVLNDSDRVHPDTAEKVWASIRALNYVPNRAARTLQSGRSGLIGVIVSDITNPYYAELVRSVAVAAAEQQYGIVTFDLNYDTTLMIPYLEQLREYKPDGLLLFAHAQGGSVLESLRQPPLPTVVLNWGVPERWISKLGVDYLPAMYALVKYLTDLGHRRLAYVSGYASYGDSSGGKRLSLVEACQAFRSEMEAPIFMESDLSLSHEAATEFVDQLMVMSAGARPTAILAANDLMAISIMHALQDAGVDVPGQVSLIGIDDIDWASFLRPTLTTLRQPRRQTGALAFELLRQLLDEEVSTGVAEAITPRLIRRESTGAAKPW